MQAEIHRARAARHGTITMIAPVGPAQVRAAMRRVAAALTAQADTLTRLDRALGDGDLGATATRIAETLHACADGPPEPDLGKLIAQAGIAVSRAAPPTMGALIGTALMRAGQLARGEQTLAPVDLAQMLAATEAGIHERGKARPGDKTVIDVLHAAVAALDAAVAAGMPLPEAGARMLAAAREGRDAMTALPSRVGRASWLGERSAGHVDPGAALAVIVLEAIAG